jgi:CDP-glucose 4,6-dehydratase
MQSINEFYAGRRVLVTGHTGFKGGWLCAWLKQAGAEVAGLALPPEDGQPSLFEDTGVARGMVSRLGDIRDLATVEAAFAEARPEIVFHLAAQPLVRRSYRDPVGTFATNVMGTVHVLEAARRCPSVGTVVAVTTDKVYANEEWAWGYREIDRLGGKDPYSSSKACAELAAGAYRATLFAMDGRAIRLATARGGNVVGGGDWSEDRLVPDIVRAILADRPMVLRNPRATRPWQHVLELVRGYLMLARRLETDGAAFEGAWNFGPGSASEADVETVTRRFAAAWGGGLEIQVTPSPLREAHFLKLDIAKAVAELDWRPLLGFDETIDMTADWYRRHAAAPQSAAELVEAQINAYCGRMTA